MQPTVVAAPRASLPQIGEVAAVVEPYKDDRMVVFTQRPGRVKRCVDIDLPRPRELNVKRNRRFLEYEDEIWSSIEGEARASA
jgi:ABC-type nitrate/sulfonate/bicarbonate transport system ATPase subunit